MTHEEQPLGKVEANDKTELTCRVAQILIVVVATLLHGIFLSKAKPLHSANDRSRWCTVWSLVERGTYQIDEIRQRPGWDTIDMVHVDDHFYSTKPPLLSTVVAGVTWCVQRVTGWKLIEQTQAVSFIVLLLVNVVPFVVSMAATIAIVNQITSRSWTRLFSVMIAAFGTLLTPFLMTLNNHTVAAASTTIALFALLKLMKGNETRPANWPFALCGFAAAWTVSNELPALCLAAMLFAIAIRRSRKKALFVFLPAAFIPIFALVLTNVIATGSWKPVYADYGTDKYRFVIDGIPSYWMEPHGVDRNLDSPWMYFVHCTVGHHGLFSLTPIALLAVGGWLASFRLRDQALRVLLWLSAATTAIVVSFYLTRIQNYNYGGVSCGLRWALWLTPLLLFSAVPIFDFLSKWSITRAVAILLASVSMYSAWEPIENPWRQPWLFQWMESRGWIDYSEERPKLEKPLWTWFASLPAVANDDVAWIEFSVAQPGLAPRIIRLSARHKPGGKSGDRMELEVRETSGYDETSVRVRTFLIETQKFNEGLPPGDFLRWSDSKTTAAQKQDDLAFVRGLPRKVPFEAKVIRYLKTPLRPEAFRCQQAAAHVSYAANSTNAPLNYRCDTWLTNDVPFGIAQVEFHISQPETGATLFHERWTVRDCSPTASPYGHP